MITLLFCLELLASVYLLVAFLMVSILCIKNYNVTVTHFDTNEKEEITGFRKIKYYIFMALLWPITIKLRG